MIRRRVHYRKREFAYMALVAALLILTFSMDYADALTAEAIEKEEIPQRAIFATATARALQPCETWIRQTGGDARPQEFFSCTSATQKGRE